MEILDWIRAMIFELPEEGYRFDNYPGENWLPSPYCLFNFENEKVPSPETIRCECESIKSGWDDRERFLRKLRAQVACEFGVCRNF